MESAVGYVKKNLLAGLGITDFSQLNPIARQWLEEIANVRVHGETRRRPAEMFEEERPTCNRCPTRSTTSPACMACAPATVSASPSRPTATRCRPNTPPRHLTLKAHPEHICIYREERLVARHPRSYDRHRDFENPDHPKALLAQRRSARQQRRLQRFLALAPCAERYYAGAAPAPPQPHPPHPQDPRPERDPRRAGHRPRARRRVALPRLGSEYIANLLESRARRLDEPGPLHLTRSGDALELELPDPDLSDYDRHLDEETDT